MKSWTREIAALLLAVAIGTPGGSALADGHCDGEPNTHKLKVKIKKQEGKDMPDAVIHDGSDRSAESISVCLNDYVEWKLQGSDKMFFVEIQSGPMAGAQSEYKDKKEVFQVTTGRKGDVLKYDIQIVGGGRMDPRIVIDD